MSLFNISVLLDMFNQIHPVLECFLLFFYSLHYIFVIICLGVQRDPNVWFMRPLSPALLNVLALETFYLLSLRTALMDEIMSDLTRLVDGYLNAFREGSAESLGSTEVGITLFHISASLVIFRSNKYVHS